MDNKVLWSAEQINIPQDLGSIIKDYTKKIIREQPKDTYKCYFAGQCGLPTPFPEGEEEDLEETDNFIPPLVIVGPSGVGKSTLVEKLMKEYPSYFGFSVSHTTRAPRENEVNGVHYHFTDKETILSKLNNEEFLESAEVHGNIYGTSYDSVQKVIRGGRCCILDVDVQGAQQIKRSNLRPVVTVFVRPPSIQDLEQRLRSRMTESEDKIALRVSNATKEMSFMNDKQLFDHVIINDDFDRCYSEFKNIIETKILPKSKSN
ncbi:guanylate kinase [Acrasis kona]|uniref:guanylate kinase n=1 Tax=Acrasis kona TaxID=1008807 RepID=A0AAW2YT72_9EUKA